MSMAPVAPMGCPSAMAPPFTLHLSQSAPVSRRNRSTTEANASFTSIRSMSSSVMPALASTRFVAGPGAVSMITGSAPATAVMRTRARGLSPCALA